MNDPRIHFVIVKLRSALRARAQLSSPVSGEHKLQNPQHQRIRGYGLKTTPPLPFPEAPKTRIQIDCGHSCGRDVHFLPCLTRKQLRVFLFRLAGQLQRSIRWKFWHKLDEPVVRTLGCVLSWGVGKPPIHLSASQTTSLKDQKKYFVN